MDPIFGFIWSARLGVVQHFRPAWILLLGFCGLQCGVYVSPRGGLAWGEHSSVCVYLYIHIIYIYTYYTCKVDIPHTYTHYAHRHACIHAYMHTCIHAYIRTYIHTYIHTYLHTLKHIAMQHVTLHYIALHNYIAVRYITLRYVTLRYITLHYITIHYIALHYNTYVCMYVRTCMYTSITISSVR